MSDTLLQVDALVKRFHRVPAVDGVSFSVRAGELVGLIGPNGAGKSTTLRTVCGELLPDEGEVRVAGHDVTKEPLAARRVTGYVPQGVRLFPFLTAQELLDFVGEVKGLAPDDRDAQVAELLERLALDDARHRLTRELSGGTARKLALAAAMLGTPPLLVLDESLNGIDPRAAFTVKEMLRHHTDGGGAVVLASHVLETMERLCTRVLLLHQGRVLDDLDRDALAALAKSGCSLEDHFLKRTD